MQSQRSVRFKALVWIALVALAAGSARSFASSSKRFNVVVDEPFEVAGRLFAAGTLSIRHLSDFTPSLAIQEVWAGRDCLGMMMARLDPSARSAGQEGVLFVRDHTGRLSLHGFVHTGRGRARVFRFEHGAPGKDQGPLSQHQAVAR